MKDNCPSCDVPYVEHPGLISCCQELRRVKKERDAARKLLSEIEAPCVIIDGEPRINHELKRRIDAENGKQA